MVARQKTDNTGDKNFQNHLSDKFRNEYFAIEDSFNGNSFLTVNFRKPREKILS